MSMTAIKLPERDILAQEYHRAALSMIREQIAVNVKTQLQHKAIARDGTEGVDRMGEAQYRIVENRAWLRAQYMALACIRNRPRSTVERETPNDDYYTRVSMLRAKGLINRVYPSIDFDAWVNA